MYEARLSFQNFISIVTCFYNEDLHRELLRERRDRLIEMVFRNLEGFDDTNEDYVRLQNLRAANCVKILGSGVIRVVHRVEDARENNVLDLSDCQLIQVPDAVYFMMKNTSLSSCNLSFNVITKIPPKLPITFNTITELNLAHNRISTLPDELEECTELERVDVSHNSLISIPFCLYSMPKLKEIKASKNFIADVDVDALNNGESLEYLNIEDNPLSRSCLETLASQNVNFGRVQIKFTSRELEEWEDLSV